eukprot:CAMPEP_0184487386 /NCGR_PEP_ID=MMETSP0113_2-20130426/9968_1 /TAXON_ID=91329 /ORGANISM="Norrisiella sphaerica, Strain BC52" /LENGTH=279 /DNA_ID=CAMNT_0026869679 /DNA_START=332 /DNA_END=1171 /DNA_ORIENTATION=+
MVTTPADVIKARMQTAGEIGTVKNNNAVRIFDIIRAEGLGSLYRGVGVSMGREASLNVIRLGLYDPLMSQMHEGYKSMDKVNETGIPPLYKRLLCGCICGVLGSIAANPLELIKCRIQCASPAAPSRYQYRGGYDAMRQIIASEGIPGLWNGARVFALRNAVGTAANLSTFSTLKANLLSHFEDSIVVDCASALGSGFVTTLVMCPLDVVKTRVQNQPVDKLGNGVLYKNGADATMRIIHNEGVFALWKGFATLFVRTGPHYVLTFSIYGLLKRWMAPQ